MKNIFLTIIIVGFTSAAIAEVKTEQFVNVIEQGQEKCFSLQKFTDTIPTDANFSLDITKVEVFANHSVGNLISRHRSSLTTDSLHYMNGDQTPSAIAQKIISGGHVTENFLQELKKSLNLYDSYETQKQGSAVYSRVKGNYGTPSPQNQLNRLFYEYGVYHIFGYLTHGYDGIFQKSCDSFSISDRNTQYKIVEQFENGFNYVFEASNEYYELRVFGTPENGEIKIDRYWYYTLPHQCGAGILSYFEVHPIKISYSLKFGPSVKLPAANKTELKITMNGQEKDLVANLDSSKLCANSTSYAIFEIDKSFEEKNPQLSKYLKLPIVNFNLSFEEGNAIENSLLAKKYLMSAYSEPFRPLIPTACRPPIPI